LVGGPEVGGQEFGQRSGILSEVRRSEVRNLVGGQEFCRRSEVRNLVGGPEFCPRPDVGGQVFGRRSEVGGYPPQTSSYLISRMFFPKSRLIHFCLV